jgi:hypothetical protein
MGEEVMTLKHTALRPSGPRLSTCLFLLKTICGTDFRSSNVNRLSELSPLRKQANREG